MNDALYSQWRSFRARAKKAGIGVDPRWATFQGYLDNQPAGRPYEPGLCLCRTSDKGDYTPDNTRWDTRGNNSREHGNCNRSGDLMIEVLTAALARLAQRGTSV